MGAYCNAATDSGVVQVGFNSTMQVGAVDEAINRFFATLYANYSGANLYVPLDVEVAQNQAVYVHGLAPSGVTSFKFAVSIYYRRK